MIEVSGELLVGETGCYDYEATFTPVETNQFRLAAIVTISNHSGWLPGGKHCPGTDFCRCGPDVKVSFDLTEKEPIEEGRIPIVPTATLEPTLTATIQPTPTAQIEPTQSAETNEPQPTETIEPLPSETIEPTATETFEPTVFDVQFSPDGKFVVSGVNEGVMRLWGNP